MVGGDENDVVIVVMVVVVTVVVVGTAREPHHRLITPVDTTHPLVTSLLDPHCSLLILPYISRWAVTRGRCGFALAS